MQPSPAWWPLQTPKNRCFAVDGDLSAVRQIKRMVDRTETRTLELRPGTKHLLFAASLLLTVIQVPLLMTAQQALRESGVSGNALAELVEDLASGALTGFLRTSRSTWAGPLSDCSKESAATYFAELSETHSNLAVLLKNLLAWANAAAGQPEMSRSHWA